MRFSPTQQLLTLIRSQHEDYPAFVALYRFTQLKINKKSLYVADSAGPLVLYTFARLDQ